MVSFFACFVIIQHWYGFISLEMTLNWIIAIRYFYKILTALRVRSHWKTISRSCVRMVLLALARSILLTPASATQLWYWSCASSAWSQTTDSGKSVRKWQKHWIVKKIHDTAPFVISYLLQSLLLQPPLLLQLFVTSSVGLLLLGAVGRGVGFLVLLSPLGLQRSCFT